MDTPAEVYKKWCRVLDEAETEQFKDESRLEFFDLRFEDSRDKLKTMVEKNYPDEPFPEITRLEINIYSNDAYQEGFVLDCNNQLYIRSFLFHTLTQHTTKELVTLIIFFYLQKKGIFIDLILDLVKIQEEFLSSRKRLLKDEEYQAVFGDLRPEENHFIRALTFVSLLHYPEEHLNKITLIETKILKEIYFSRKMKKLLNLDENDYEYIQASHPWERLSPEEKEKFTVIRNEIENNRISIEEYVQHHLDKKKILFWCLWTISPFLAIDISRLFSALHEYKTIKKVYLDMPSSSQDTFNRFIEDNQFPEYEVENEIKKIYPSVVNDYAKETLPYLKLLERLQLFKIPQKCIGVDGDELSRRLPFLKDNQLLFEIDDHWENNVHKEMKKLDSQDEHELTIFFYFLKPMNYLPPYVREHTSVEALIHTDPFTGYGPNRCENQLSFYSHYHPLKQQIPSFILTDLERFSIREEKVVTFPYKEEDYFRINDDQFNHFRLFNSLLFSGAGGGGRGRQSQTTPASPDFRRIRV